MSFSGRMFVVCRFRGDRYWASASMTRSLWQLLLVISLGAMGCTPMASKHSAVLSTEDSPTFPFILVDFGSVELHLVKVDGQVIYRRHTELLPGHHSVCVKVMKGPTGLFGVAPFLGTYWGTLEFDAEAGNSYRVQFDGSKEPAELILLNVQSGSILAHTPCISHTFTEALGEIAEPLPCK
jgi:hypothetical protein